MNHSEGCFLSYNPHGSWECPFQAPSLLGAYLLTRNLVVQPDSLPLGLLGLVDQVFGEIPDSSQLSNIISQGVSPLSSIPVSVRCITKTLDSHGLPGLRGPPHSL